MSKQVTREQFNTTSGEVTPTRFNRRKLAGGTLGAIGVALISRGNLLTVNAQEGAAEEDTPEDNVAMAPGSDENQSTNAFNYSNLSGGENLTAPGRMSAEDIRLAREENPENEVFMQLFYTDKSDILLSNGRLDVLKAGNAFLSGVEALLKAGCDRKTLEEGRYLDDPTPERFLNEMAAIYDMSMIRGICGFSADMPTDEHLEKDSVLYKELVMAAEASRRLFFVNAQVLGNLNQRIEVAHLESVFSEAGPEDFEGKERYSVDMYARLSNDAPNVDAQPIPIYPIEGKIPMIVDINPDKPQVNFNRIRIFEYISPLEDFGRQH